MDGEEKGPEEIQEERTPILGSDDNMEEFPIIEPELPDKEKPTDEMEKFPIIEKPKEAKPMKVKRHRFRNYLIAGLIVAGAAVVGDMYIQGSKTQIDVNTDYKPGTGYSQVLDKGIVKGGELWTATKTKTSEVVKLEERVTALKGYTKYDEYKPIYQIGGIALAAGIAAYFVGGWVERRKFDKK